jgi:alpha-L-fucosidase
VIMQERLREIGGWLERNGEAIYGTRMWRTSCQWSEGEKPESKRGEFMTGFDILKETLRPETGRAAKEVFFTCRNGDLYAISPRWPGKQLILRNVKASKKSRVTWLATGEELKWKNRKGDLVISLPEFNPEALSPELLSAYAFKISGPRKE